jgi:hypothetical protein
VDQEQNKQQVPELVQVVAAMVSENIMGVWEAIDQGDGPHDTVVALHKIHQPVCSLLDSLKTVFAMEAASAGVFDDFRKDWIETEESVTQELHDQFNRLAAEYGIAPGQENHG